MCHVDGTERSHGKAQKKQGNERLAVLTGIPTYPCNTPWGDHLISLSVQNKQDWARLHGHELHMMASSTDLRIRPGAWQKVALLLQVGPDLSTCASFLLSFAPFVACP